MSKNDIEESPLIKGQTQNMIEKLASITKITPSKKKFILRKIKDNSAGIFN